METRNRERVADLLAQVGALKQEVAQLQEALTSRIIVEQAKGAVAARCGVDPEDAFEVIRGLARSQRREIHEFCAEVVANQGRLDGLARVPLHLQT